MAVRTVVAYDIGDDGARAKVAAMLAAHGVRIQRSVYLCLIDNTTLEYLVRRASDLMDLDEDVLHAIPTCAECREGEITIGQATREGDSPFWVAF